MEKYTRTIETKMKVFYKSLSEKDKRHYSAIEALKLGYGGIKYISNLFQCSRQTIYTGIKDLEEKSLLQNDQIRVMGGGRKNYTNNIQDVDKIFLKCD
jgi:predicted transcriptional regulator